MRLTRTSALTIGLCGLLGQSLARAAPRIVSPEDGDTVPTEFTVKVTLEEVEFCDIGGCEDYSADLVRLYDFSTGRAEELAQCGSCSDCSPCTRIDEANFTVEVKPGRYTLQVRADSYVVEEFSEPIHITVEGEGCGCGVGEGPTAHGFVALLGLICMGLFRRPARCRS